MHDSYWRTARLLVQSREDGLTNSENDNGLPRRHAESAAINGQSPLELSSGRNARYGCLKSRGRARWQNRRPRLLGEAIQTFATWIGDIRTIVSGFAFVTSGIIAATLWYSAVSSNLARYQEMVDRHERIIQSLDAKISGQVDALRNSLKVQSMDLLAPENISAGNDVIAESTCKNGYAVGIKTTTWAVLTSGGPSDVVTKSVQVTCKPEFGQGRHCLVPRILRVLSHRIPEGGEHRLAHRVLPMPPLRVPLHSQQKAFRLSHADGLDRAVGRGRFLAQRRRQAGRCPGCAASSP